MQWKLIHIYFLICRFTTSINKRLVSEAQMQSSKLDIEASMKNLQDHLVSTILRYLEEFGYFVKFINLGPRGRIYRITYISCKKKFGIKNSFILKLFVSQ